MRQIERVPDAGRIIFVSIAAVIAAALLLFMAWPANAAGFTCYRLPGVLSCQRTEPRSNIIHVPEPETAEEAAAKAERIAKWESFCKPTFRTDAEGVRHYVYAQPGCASGRSE